jgi:hypothetical protein
VADGIDTMHGGSARTLRLKVLEAAGFRLAPTDL